MLRKLLEALKNLVPPPEVFDLSQLNDPLAVQIEWTPMRCGDSGFTTHKLVHVHADRVEFRPSWELKLFLGFHLFAGVLVPAAFVAIMLLVGEIGSRVVFLVLIPAVTGTLLMTIGGMIYYRHSAPIVFDRYQRHFWKGRKAPNEVLNISALKDACKLGDIHAVQLIPEYCLFNKPPYNRFELNLVLHNGRRINVIGHSNPAKLRKDAQLLARFLHVPVWDAC